MLETSKKPDTAKRDLVIIAGIALGLFVLAGYLDLTERWQIWAVAYEVWEFDEMLMVVALTSVGMAWYSYRRWREARTESEFRKVVEALRESEHALAHSVLFGLILPQPPHKMSL